MGHSVEADARKETSTLNDVLHELRGEAGLYALVDAATDPFGIPYEVETVSDEATCLFQGRAREEMGDRTAWIVPLVQNDGTDRSRAMDWCTDRWGEGSVCFLISELPLRRLATHLRHFTKVRDSEGTEHFFRFYAPDVMRQYLPVFAPEQARKWSAGIARSLTEDTRDPTKMLVFERAGERIAMTAQAIEPASHEFVQEVDA